MWSILIIYIATILITVNGSYNESELHMCGFPGIPHNGRITPDKQLYDIGEKVTYECIYKNLALMGETENECVYGDPPKWTLNEPPQCWINLAYQKKATQSSTIMDAFNAIDQNIHQCSLINAIVESNNTGYWEVNLGGTYPIVGIFHRILSSRDSPRKIKIVIGTENSQDFKLCNYFVHNPRQDNLTYVEQGYLPCITETKGSVLRIENPIHLYLCLIHVYKKSTSCGRPDVNPFCNVTVSKKTVATYKADVGHPLRGARFRRCRNGSWTDRAPECFLEVAVENLDSQQKTTKESSHLQPTSKTNHKEEKDSLSKLEYAIIISGSTAVIILIFLLICCITYKHLRKRKSCPNHHPISNPESNSSASIPKVNNSTFQTQESRLSQRIYDEIDDNYFHNSRAGTQMNERSNRMNERSNRMNERSHRMNERSHRMNERSRHTNDDDGYLVPRLDLEEIRIKYAAIRNAPPCNSAYDEIDSTKFPYGANNLQDKEYSEQTPQYLVIIK